MHVILLAGGALADEPRSRGFDADAVRKKPVRELELKGAMLGAVSQPARGPVERVDAPLSAVGGTPLRVLLAEDNVVNQKVGRRLIERLGHSVVVVGDGRQAVRAVEEQEFDVVFMDVQMPVVDGLEAAAAIRERERTVGGHRTIVAMTAHAMKGDREKCLAAGMDGYLSKPIRVEELSAVLATAVAVPKA